MTRNRLARCPGVHLARFRRKGFAIETLPGIATAPASITPKACSSPHIHAGVKHDPLPFPLAAANLAH